MLLRNKMHQEIKLVANTNILKKSTYLVPLVFLSFVLGFFRDLSIASYFGATTQADYIFLALLLPAIVENIFGISMRDALIMLISTLKDKSKASVLAVVSRIGWPLLIGTAFLCALLILWSDAVLLIIVPGWSEDLRAGATPSFQIGAVLLLMTILVYFYSSILHFNGQFAIPLWRSIFINVGALVAMLAMEASAKAVITLTVISAGLHMLLIVGKLGPGTLLTLKVKRGDTHFARHFLPLLSAAIAMQINVLAERFFASWLVEGTISQLSYAYRLATVPLTFFTLAVLSVLFTTIIKSREQGNVKQLEQQTELALALTFFAVVPSILIMMFWAEEIILLLFFRGAFSENDVHQTATMLRAYCPGVLFIALSLLLTRLALALNKVRPILLAGVVSVVMTLSLDYLLIFSFEGAGLAMAFSMGAISNAIVLLIALRNEITLGLKRIVLWSVGSIVTIGIMWLVPFSGIAGLLVSAIPVSLVSLCILYLDSRLTSWNAYLNESKLL